MKILHTSDWHLGVTMVNAPCDEEQRQFLSWLIDTINERGIDVLLVAGDVFHQRQPPNSALRLYFDFLAGCARKTDLRQIVIVGGNHDSPSGLQAAAPVLSSLQVHITGGIYADEDTWDDLLVPIYNDDDQPALVVAAVPYVQEAKLGISGVGLDPDEIAAQYHARYAHLYSTLADRAQQRYGDLPLIATGHLTTYGSKQDAQDGDFHTRLHGIGGIDTLSPTIFDPRFSYIALGHIHRQLPVLKGRAHYCGTPIPTDRTELSRRFIIQATLDSSPNNPPTLEHIEVPRWRDIFVFKGTADDVCEEFAALTTEKDLPPYIFIECIDDEPHYENPLASRLQDIREKLPEPRPRIVDLRESSPTIDELPDQEPGNLDQLTPEEVFSRAYAHAHGGAEPPQEIFNTFLELLVDELDHDDELPELESAAQSPEEVL